MKTNKKRILINVKDSLMVVVGTLLMGFAFNVFLNNNKISPSGFSGLSAIISNVLAENLNVHISASVFYLAINAILFIFAYKSLGLKFAINSAIGIVSYSLFMQFANFDIGLSGSDLLLCAIYGGVVMGVGMGLVFRGHGSTGGSDMLAKLLSKKLRFVTVGNMVFIVDFIVVGLSLIAYKNLELALYSLVAIYIMTKMADVIISGVQSLRAYYIISANYQEIADKIMKEAARGVTGLQSKGMYTKKEQNMLMTVVTRAESVKLRQIVADVDRHAFMFSCPISEAMGTGFLPLNKSKEENITEKTEEVSNDIKLEKENQKSKTKKSKTNTKK